MATLALDNKQPALLSAFPSDFADSADLILCGKLTQYIRDGSLGKTVFLRNRVNAELERIVAGFTKEDIDHLIQRVAKRYGPAISVSGKA